MTEDLEVSLPATRRLTLDARSIAYCELGDPAGTPVIAAHGSPGSRYQLLALEREALRANVRIICPDRPGYGDTSREPRRGFDTGSGDAIALLDALEISRAVALGFSGGAGYSLALALAHPDRIERVVLACGMIPGAPRRTVRGRIPIVSALYRVARVLPSLAVMMLDGRGPFASTREANLSAWPAADQAIMADPRARAMTAPDSRAAAKQGSRAAVDDLRQYSRPFPLTQVHQRVDLLHGTADGNVPVDVARWGRSQLRDAVLREIPGGGHYFAVADPGAVVAALRAPLDSSA